MEISIQRHVWLMYQNKLLDNIQRLNVDNVAEDTHVV